MQGVEPTGGGRMSHSVTDDTRRGLRTLLTASPAARIRAARAAFAAQGWEVAYRRRLLVTDTVVIVVAVLVAYFLRWDAVIDEPVSRARVPYVVLSVLVGVAWSVSLVASRTRDPRVMGSGPTEYHRVFDASWRLFAVLAVLAFLLRFPETRGYLAFAFPLGLAGLLAGRYAWRQWLHRQRAHGGMRSAVLAIGHRDQAERLIRDLNSRDESGYRVVGVCVPSGGFGAGRRSTACRSSASSGTRARSRPVWARTSSRSPARTPSRPRWCAAWAGSSSRTASTSCSRRSSRTSQVPASPSRPPRASRSCTWTRPASRGPSSP